jgi:hypothetical protein
MRPNPIESIIEIVRHHARNLKHGQRGDMPLRWAAAGMLAASAQSRRVKGYRQLPTLAVALRPAIGVEHRPTIAVSARPNDQPGGRHQIPRRTGHPLRFCGPQEAAL